MIPKAKEKEIFPSYSMILDDESRNYLTTYLKMYQIYHSIDRAFVFENSLYKNHFVRLQIGTDDIVFPWLEFATYEIVDLINGLHTLADGVYVVNIKAADFLKTLNFELFWEQLEDWSEYISLDDFKEGETPNLEYIFKMFKCTEHWVEKHGEFPKEHKDYLKDVMINIDEYYATYILNAIPEGEMPGDAEINAGVLALEESNDDTPPEDDPEDSSEDSTNPSDDEEEEKEPERSIKADIVTPESKEHGIHTAK